MGVFALPRHGSKLRKSLELAVFHRDETIARVKRIVEALSSGYRVVSTEVLEDGRVRRVVEFPSLETLMSLLAEIEALKAMQALDDRDRASAEADRLG